VLNEYTVNEIAVNGDASYALGTFITIEKTINSRVLFEGSLITIEKTIENTQAAQTLITISKIIQNGDSTFYTRNGWEPIVVLGTTRVSNTILCDIVTVNKNEGDNSTASFTVILAPNVYNLYQFQGTNVEISYRKNNIINRLFTGKVDVPALNIFEEKLTLNCVADRRVLLSSLSSVEPYIGYYSESVLGKSDEVIDRINARLSTIPSSLDFDSFNRYSLTSWTPKATADFSYGSSDVYRREPQMSIDSSGQITNKVTINLEYGYQRHHHREAFYSWAHPYNPTDYTTGEGNICPFLQDAPTMPSKELILSAINSAGWPVNPNSLYFGKQFKSGSYYCSGVWAQWSTVQTTVLNLPVKDSNGNAVLDANGNPVLRSVTQQLADYTNTFTMYAQWTASTRFNQNVKEAYTVVIQAPESVTRYGVIPAIESYGYTAVDEYSTWEDYQGYKSAPTGVTTYTDVVSGSYFFNANQDRSTFNKAYVCALNKAKTTILSSHRQSRITFQRELIPTIELKHTCAVTGKWMRGKGKVERITHYMDCNKEGAQAYTEVTLLQYRGQSTVSETALVPTSAPSDTNVPTQVGGFLQTHLGEDPSQPSAINWNGYVGNKAITQNLGGGGVNYTRTNYQESFIVDTPAVPNELRKDRKLVASATYNVNIPNDNHEYESYG
jgi:hypothetical protein